MPPRFAAHRRRTEHRGLGAGIDRAGRQRPPRATDALFRSGQRPLFPSRAGRSEGRTAWANSCPRSERSGNSCDCDSTIDCVASAEQVLASLARARWHHMSRDRSTQPFGCATACNPSGVCDTLPQLIAACQQRSLTRSRCGVFASSGHAPEWVTRPSLRPPCLVPSPPTKRLTSETKNPSRHKPKMSRKANFASA